MGKLKIEQFVHEELNLLIDKLHDKKYFGYKSEAVKYVLAIYDFIDTIPNQQFYKTNSFQNNEYFCRFSPNKHTTYYITFDIIGDNYLIKIFFNNHGKQYDNFLKHF